MVYSDGVGTWAPCGMLCHHAGGLDHAGDHMFECQHTLPPPPPARPVETQQVQQETPALEEKPAEKHPEPVELALPGSPSGEHTCDYCRNGHSTIGDLTGRIHEEEEAEEKGSTAKGSVGSYRNMQKGGDKGKGTGKQSKDASGKETCYSWRFRQGSCRGDNACPNNWAHCCQWCMSTQRRTMDCPQHR